MSSLPTAPRRQLGSSDLWVSPVALGCWPLAGITSLIDSERECIATIQAAIEAGINFFDTAYSYGYDGQSDRLLKEALAGQREQVIIASKVGMHWNASRERVLDATPATLIDHAAQVLRRLQVDAVDIMYLHTPDGRTPIEASAEAIAQIIDKGWARYAAVSNVDADQAARFHAICPVIAVQPCFNMLQQESVANLREFCRSHSISLACYWVLMKGLLAGHLQRDHQFDPRDSRLKYDIFRGDAWQRNQDLVDCLRQLASRTGHTVSQLVIAWTLAQPDITVALCGAKRPAQIRDNAGAMLVELDCATLAEIDGYIAQHGANR